MATITVRTARMGDGAALERLHEELGRYYAHLAPRHFQVPALAGLADEVDTALARVPQDELHLVAEVDAEVVGALAARLLSPEEGAERQIAQDLGALRLRIDYLVTASAHRRRGVGTLLVQAAEAWAQARGATVSETWTYQDSPLSMPFWTRKAAYEVRSVNLRKPLGR